MRKLLFTISLIGLAASTVGAAETTKDKPRAKESLKTESVKDSGAKNTPLSAAALDNQIKEVNAAITKASAKLNVRRAALYKTPEVANLHKEAAAIYEKIRIHLENDEEYTEAMTLSRDLRRRLTRLKYERRRAQVEDRKDAVAKARKLKAAKEASKKK